MIYLLCCFRPRVHMELRKADTESAGYGCRRLVNIWSVRKQTVAKGRCRGPKRSVKCEQWEWD